MIERGISKHEATEVIQKGAKTQQGKKILAQMKNIEVVFVQRPCNYHVITLYRG